MSEGPDPRTGPQGLAACTLRLRSSSPEAAAELATRQEDLRRRLGADGLLAFVEAGLALEPNREALRAYFTLASARAEEQLRRYERRVAFADHVRVLRLFGEGLAGHDVRIEALAASPTAHRVGSVGLPTSDGSTIYLPPLVDEMPDAASNLTLYRLAILHQLGLYRFGTFALELGELRRRVPEWEELGRRRRRPREPEGATPFRLFFDGFPRPSLARRLFAVLEDARIDAHLERRYRGVEKDLAPLRRHSLERRPPIASLEAGRSVLEGLVRWSLGEAAPRPPASPRAARCLVSILDVAAAVLAPGASVYTSARITVVAYRSIMRAGLMRATSWHASEEGASAPRDGGSGEATAAGEEGGEMPLPVLYRGEAQPELVQKRMMLAALLEELERRRDSESAEEEGAEGEAASPRPEGLGAMSLLDGDLFASSELLQGLDDLSKQEAASAPDADAPAPDGVADGLAERIEGLVQELQRSRAPVQADDGVFYYDEWDHEIGDYLRRWCRLRESALAEDDSGFVDEARLTHAALLQQIRRQFERLKPELRRRVRRLIDGEELDLDAAIEALLDRRAGISPAETLYSRRQKQDRDVAAVFLLDLSASTDSEVPVAAAATTTATGPPTPEFVGILDEEPLWGPWPQPGQRPARRRVVDVEKEALVLMAEALETLGDAYAIYGFSGYGRQKVDFYVAKEFSDHYDHRVQSRIAAMEPRQSTRMGPAIRHALRKLEREQARVKTLLILSDGYPQDHDYGRDRAGREYGIQDTMMALREAQLQGVHTFCITVDPAGHDYLRAMCPDDRYLVIDDIAALPDELPKVYRALTT